MGGSGSTLFNVHPDADAGSSWRQVCPMGDAESQCVLPGGNDGSPFSDHYADQLEAWARGEFKPMDRAVSGDPDVRFDGGDG
jgi:penicillin amidase